MFNLKKYVISQLKNPKHVNRAHVDQIVNVVTSTDSLFVPVCPILLEVLHHVDPNASSAVIVYQIKLAAIENVLTLVKELVG